MNHFALNLGGGPSNALDACALALRERRPAAVLAGLDALGLPETLRAAALACVWFEAGSVRGIAGLGPLGDWRAEAPAFPGLAAALEAVMPHPDTVSDILAKSAFPERDWPRAEAAALELMRDAASRAGRAAELVRVHLALSEHAPRVDTRVGLVEAAESIAHVLDDRVLHLLVQAFFARVDADFGEDDDARQRVDAVLADPAIDDAPRARAVALAVRVLLARRAGDEAVETQAAAMREAWRVVGWGDGPAPDTGPCWGFIDPA
jgi:hypothetical protein